MALLGPVVTNITNTSGHTRVYGSIPSHGKELTNNETISIAGDIYSQMGTGGGRLNKRKFDALEAAIEAGNLTVNVNHREIVYGSVLSATAIAKNDLLWLDTNTLKPASAFAWDTDLLTTQTAFKAKFVGVALDAHAANSGNDASFPVDVSDESVYVYSRASATNEVGDPQGPAKASGNALENQKLVGAVLAAAIAKATKKTAVASTSVSVRLLA